jgi:hypothetical protein
VWPAVTAAQARKQAEKLRGSVLTGADPVAELRDKRVATLAAEAEARRKKAADGFTGAVANDVEIWLGDISG